MARVPDIDQPMDKSVDTIPRMLGPDLALRWGRADDVEALAEFNYRLHNDNPGGRPEHWLKNWTRALAGGRHPTTDVSDFILVEDRSKGGKIVSVTVLISQTWAYDGIPFGCGRPELVGTDEAYRRRGLVRASFEAIHRKSESRGDLVQAITGLPWFYRQFGYEMALDLGGSRTLQLGTIKGLPEGEKEKFRLRRADLGDLPSLKELYEIQCRPSLMRCLREDEEWRYELSFVEKGIVFRHLYLIENDHGRGIGYAALYEFPKRDGIGELAVLPGCSLREVALFLARTLKNMAIQEPSDPDQSITEIKFRLGRHHPAYEALAEELGSLEPPYAWYIRLPDLPAFLKAIRSVLEERLRGSAMAGFTGQLKLNFYRWQLALIWQDGRLTDVRSYEPESFWDGHGYFPDLTFLQLLFGYRSLGELKHARADLLTQAPQTPILLEALFPSRPSHVIPLA